MTRTNTDDPKRLLAAFLAAAVLLSSVQPAAIGLGEATITYRSGENFVLTPTPGSGGGNAGGGGTLSLGLAQSPPQTWSEPFSSAPQGVPVAQWASANGYPYEGTAPASGALSLNVTGGALVWNYTWMSRVKGVYNFTLWKDFGIPLYAYNLSITINATKGGSTVNSPPTYFTVTAYGPSMDPVLVLRFNTSGNDIYGNASAYGSTVPLSSFTGIGGEYTAYTFNLSCSGYGAQATLKQGQSTKLSFTCYTPLKYLALNYFINETAYPNYDSSYAIKVEAISLAPAATAPAIINAPAGEWWYTLHDGQTAAWTVPPGNGSGTLDLANLPTAFNGEFSAATTGAWKPQGLSVFSVSGGKLNTKGSGTEITNNGLGQPSSAFPGAYYALPTQGGGDFYVAVRVDLSGWTTSPSYAARIGVAITDASGNVMAYLTAKFYNPKMSSTVNLQDSYYGVQPNAAGGGTLLRSGRSSLTVNISRTGSTWNIYCPETETNYTAVGTTAPIGGILLHHTNTENSMNGGWDYVRTNLPAELWVLCGSPIGQAGASGTFTASTTLSLVGHPSQPALVPIAREDASGLKFSGVAEGDVVTLFDQAGSVAFNATVPAGATEVAVSGVALPFSGSTVVMSRPGARPAASLSTPLSNGDTFALSPTGALSKTGTGGGWAGALVTGLQQGWKVTVSNGTHSDTKYANASGCATVSALGGTAILSVWIPALTKADAAPAAASASSPSQARFVLRLERTAAEGGGGAGGVETDVLFLEISQASFSYRFEIKAVSQTVLAGGTPLVRLAFECKSYRNGALLPEAAPLVSVAGGTPFAPGRTGAYAYAVFLPATGGPVQVAFTDPATGITLRATISN